MLGGDEKKRRIHWIAWDKLCFPKTQGGMGFRHMASHNLVLLAQQGWRLINRPNALITQILKARYYPDCEFMNAELGCCPSYTWQSILKGREILKRGLKFQLGTGEQVSLWNDPWIPLLPNFWPFSAPMLGTEDWRLSDVIDESDMTWNDMMVRDLFSEIECGRILGIPLSLRRPQDKLVWIHNKKGAYDVKSGYKVAFSLFQVSMGVVSTSQSSGASCGSGRTPIWKRIWSSSVPPKVRAFVWKLCKGVFPTRQALSKKVRFIDTRCPPCEGAVEMDVHLFRDCKVVWQCWDAANLGFDPRKFQGHNAFQWSRM